MTFLNFSFLKNPKNRELASIWRQIGDYAEDGDKAIKIENGKSGGYIFEESKHWKHFSVISGKKDAFFSADSPRFLIFRKDKIFKKINQNQDWYPVFDGFHWVVYENKNKTSLPYPLRFGLNDNEKKMLLSVSRKAIAKFLENGEILELDGLTISARFYFKIDLDVSIWDNGQLRGSAVVTGRSLAEGIIEASLAAIRDQRFKPVSLEELSESRIEIIIFSNFRSILDKNFIRKNKIIFDKGYLLSKGAKSGWFLPEAFNVRRYTNLNNFLGDLAQEKAGLPREIYRSNEAIIEIFNVIDFIEGENQEEIFDLHGPIIIPKNNPIEKNISPDLDKMLKQAGDWLLNMQEEDGNFVPIINPLTGSKTQIDWPRSILSAWSLAELSKITCDEKYLKAAEKYYKYLEKYLKDKNYEFLHTSLNFAYVGNLALSLQEYNDEYFKESIKLANFLVSYEQNALSADPITGGQILSFLSALAIRQKITQNVISGDLLELIKKSAAKLETDFKVKSKRLDCNLALWAELIHSFKNLFEVLDEEYYRNLVFEIADWLVKFQNDNGSFWGTNNQPEFVYTRGTAKMFEILPDALGLAIKINDKSRIEKYERAISKCLTWLREMQYDENNVFFIRPNIKEKVFGGFRHDYFNQEAWVDAAAHFILGGTRLLKAQLNGKRK